MEPLTQQLLFDDGDEVSADLLFQRQKLLTLLDDIVDKSDSEDELDQCLIELVSRDYSNPVKS